MAIQLIILGRMIYRIIADLALGIHFLWILFMLFGFLFNFIALFKTDLLNWRGFRLLHLIGILVVTVLAFFKEPCPLTRVENYFRSVYDPQAMYTGSCIEHYLETEFPGSTAPGQRYRLKNKLFPDY